MRWKTTDSFLSNNNQQWLWHDEFRFNTTILVYVDVHVILKKDTFFLHVTTNMSLQSLVSCFGTLWCFKGTSSRPFILYWLFNSLFYKFLIGDYTLFINVRWILILILLLGGLQQAYTTQKWLTNKNIFSCFFNKSEKIHCQWYCHCTIITMPPNDIEIKLENA